ncbi:hypothetical protein OXX79_014111 [Metschnikowia pulcherrima]
MGFLLVVLAGISGNWFPIVDGIIFAIAYLPVIISRSSGSISQFCSIIRIFLTTTAVVLTLLGGSLIYGTVYTFSQTFDNPEDSEGDIGSGVI